MGKDVIDKKLIEHLAGLARLNLDEDEEKIIDDLKEIVGYFEILKEVDIEGAEPVSGGTSLLNVVREDRYDEGKKLDGEGVVQSFPEEKDGYLKVPPVFE